MSAPTKKYRTEAKRIKLRRLSRLRKIKTSKGCENCGYNESPIALDFAHKDPKNKNLVCTGNRNGRGIDTLYKRICIKDKKKNTYHIKQLFLEIRKCKILCKNCHTIETFKNKEYNGLELHAIRMNMKNKGQKNEKRGNLENFF